MITIFVALLLYSVAEKNMVEAAQSSESMTGKPDNSVSFHTFTEAYKCVHLLHL